MALERDMSYPRDEPRTLPSYPQARPTVAARPPLTKRMRTVHWMAIDVVVATATVLLVLFASLQAAGPGGTTSLAQLMLAAAIFFPIALRRRGPVIAYGILVIVAFLLPGTVPAVSLLVFLAAAYVLYLVTATSDRRTGAAALALGLGVLAPTAIGDRAFRHGGGSGLLITTAFALLIAWMIGYSVRQRRLYAQTLQQQAASSAVAEERLRIARELHDVVAHSMSVIAVQAGYGQYVIDSSPADARDALGAIQATSRDALDEMRRMLGVLRQQDAAPGPGRPARAPLAPAPGLSDLDRLINRTRGAGVEVTVERSGRVRAVPAGVDLSAFRIIQEALTNVVRHAGGGARCTVSLDYGDTALDIRVTDDGGLMLAPVGASQASASQASTGHAAAGPAVTGPVADAGTGHGLIGMRERAKLCGGEFSAGPLPDGGFGVTATLPLLAA